MMKNNLEELNKLPVSKAVLKNAIPSMLAMLMVLIYNMADLFFIGQTGNDLFVASVSLTSPIFLLFMSCGNVFGLGGASFISRSLGEGNHDIVKRISSFCFWGCIAVGTLLSISVFCSIDTIINILGASSQTGPIVKSYIQVFCLCGPFLLISTCYSALIRGEGKPQKAMTGMLVGNIVNIVLDPIFILVFNMGVEGAAIATVIGNVCSTIFYLRYLSNKKTLLSIHPKDFSMKETIFKSVVMIGVPASLTSILNGVSQVLLNNNMSQYGDYAVAGIGVALKVTMISTMICIGIAMGIQPLLGYCIGSKNEERYHKIFNFSILFALGLSATLTVLCYLGLEHIVNAFVSDSESFEYAYYFAQVMISTGVVMSMSYILANALQAAGAAKSALVINTCRQGTIYIPLLFIMGDLFGIDGLVFAQPISDVISVLLAFTMYKIVSKNFFPKKTEIETNS
ncbi:MATE family efflux transporter [Tannockella kyphosi]|uniref:MATE family efflux transporter n=1 Tax=Tannockella kyphosi TaxID=2899121 RepID=UPI002012A7D5|nr:MATE family efflux transporter [Tannockella kyphosi]